MTECTEFADRKSSIRGVGWPSSSGLPIRSPPQHKIMRQEKSTRELINCHGVFEALQVNSLSLAQLILRFKYCDRRTFGEIFN